LPIERQEIGRQGETILLSKPGITGLWQVSGRSETSYQYRMSLDLWYVRNWNLWLDVVILLKTIRIVFKKEGAY
jgi:undecaprenyl-phosphate galactose phosphotransferase